MKYVGQDPIKDIVQQSLFIKNYMSHLTAEHFKTSLIHFLQFHLNVDLQSIKLTKLSIPSWIQWRSNFSKGWKNKSMGSQCNL